MQTVTTTWHGISVTGSVYTDPGDVYDDEPTTTAEVHHFELEDPDAFEAAEFSFLSEMHPLTVQMIHDRQRQTGNLMTTVEEELRREHLEDMIEALMREAR